MSHTMATPSDEQAPAPPAAAGQGSGGQESREQGESRFKLNPTHLAYLIGPVAFAAVLLLMRFNLVVRESAWLWLAVFIAVPATSLVVNHLYDVQPSRLRLHLRVAGQAAGVTAVIYLTGWGPVLSGAFAFLALENVAYVGSRVWRITAFWSLVGIGIGQLAIWQHVSPSVLSLSQSNALALMGAFVLFFIIRMAGATAQQKEDAEASMRLSEDRFRSLIQNSSDTTMVMDAAGLCTYISPAITELLGREPSEVVGRLGTDFVHPDDRARVEGRLGADFHAPEGGVLLQFRMARSNGTWRDVEAVVTNQLDRPSVAGYVANVRDITERKEFEALLAHRALHDPLTGLANRQLILDRAEQMLVRARRACDPVAAYFIDLDNFKDANDSLGHEAGDKLLRAVAARFGAILRASDTVGRLGGDEFVILAEGVSLAAGPLLVADRIREVLAKPFTVEGYEGLPITVTASIGIATGDRPSAQELLRDADIALYRAKAAGRDGSVLFEAAMQSAAVDRLALKSDLDSALALGQFFLLYQPIFDLDSVAIRGVEALIRWQHPSRGVISPDDFIPVLEDSGMIVEVGRWVLDEACAQAASWHRSGHATTMSVNVSMRQLESDTLVDHVRAALAASGLEPQSLIIEVTESTLMKDANATVSRLRKLKDLGVMIAIDDFGTGYSSMAYLRQFPVDVLKIDRSFVAEMDGTPDSAALIHTLVELGRTLGLVTLAEGIEDHSQLEGLRQELCDRGQGFIFSRPVAPAAIEALLAQARPEEIIASSSPDRTSTATSTPSHTSPAPASPTPATVIAT
jgi:diguanylate cyclase (GGDEF)-like protein/PAS domain S-box-containing protein